ncbi:hypothetical protein ACSQ67_008469 [Phaseolus vulgaris]
MRSSTGFHVVIMFFILAFNNYRIRRKYLRLQKASMPSSILEDNSSNLAAENLDKNLEFQKHANYMAFINIFFHMLQQFELENNVDEMKLILKSLQNLRFTIKW